MQKLIIGCGNKFVYFTLLSLFLFFQPSQLFSGADRNPDEKGKSLTLGDPISARTRSYYFHVPMFNLGGSLPVKFGLVYQSRANIRSHNYFLPSIPRLKRWGTSSVYMYRWGEGEDEILFENSESDGSGDWQNGPYSTYQYDLQEVAGAGNWFYMLDPSDQTIYMFEKDSNADDGTPSAQVSRLRYHMDRNGNMVNYTYDSWNYYPNITITDGARTIMLTTDGVLLKSVSDGIRSYTLSHNVSSHVTGITDPLNNTTTYQYFDANSDCLTRQVLPEGNFPYTQTYEEGPGGCLVTSQTDADNKVTTLSVQSNAAPTPDKVTETRPDGSEVVYEHPHQGASPLSLEDAQGNKADFTVNSHDQMTAITDRLGDTTSMTYHADTGFLSSFTNAEGNSVNHTYSAQTQSFINPANAHTVTFTFYNRTRTDYPDATFETFAYDSKGNLITHTDRNTKSTTYTYNTQGLPLTITNPTGGVSTYTYNTDGTSASSTDSDRGVTSYGYDTFKRVNVINPPGAGQINIEYDAMDRVTLVTDENGHSYQYRYDANGNLVKVTDPVGNFTEYGYDLMDRVSQIINHSGAVSTMNYNYRGQITSSIDANAIKTDYGYNDRNWLQSITRNAKSTTFSQDKEGIATGSTSASGRRMQQQSDKLGYLKNITTPGGETTRISRDKMTNVTDIIDPLNRNTHYTYDNNGRLSQVKMPDNTLAIYSRNTLGKMIRLSDLNGKEWDFTYSAMGRLSSTSDPLGNMTQYNYNIRNYLSSIVYPNGSTETFSYDNSANLLQRLFSDSTDLTFTYDALNNLSTTNNLTLSRDSEGRITSSTYRGTSFGVTYDAGGRVATAIYDGIFTVTYTYDADNHLSRVSDTLGNRIDMTYDADGNLLTLVRSNGVNSTFTWNSNGRLERLKDGVITDLHYGYNVAGELISMKGTIPLDPSQYLSKSTKNFTVDDASRINSDGYLYDNRGRVTAMPGYTLSWDAAERLIGLDDVRFEYNGFNEIISRTENTNTRYYYHNHGLGLSPIVAEQQKSTFSRYYVYTPSGQLLYAIEPQNANAVSFYHRDQVGSTLALSNSTGTVTDRYAYTPYGKVLAHVGSSDQPYTFVGALGVRQEGDLYQMRRRYYDPETASFLSREPIWPLIERPAMLNPYQYALANPLTMVDHSGLEPEYVPRGERKAWWNVYNNEWINTKGSVIDMDDMDELAKNTNSIKKAWINRDLEEYRKMPENTEAERTAKVKVIMEARRQKEMCMFGAVLDKYDMREIDNAGWLAYVEVYGTHLYLSKSENLLFDLAVESIKVNNEQTKLDAHEILDFADETKRHNLLDELEKLQGKREIKLNINSKGTVKPKP